MQRIGIGVVLVLEGLLMMMLPTPRFTILPSSVDIFILLLPPLLSDSINAKMKVIYTDAGASLPAKDGRAEILNSSLLKYSEVTLCARFLTHHFSTHSDCWPSQTLINHGKDALLSSYVARPCDQMYSGCTQEYQDIFPKDDIQWIRGKIFGYLFISDDHCYPGWWPAVWNSACISASPPRGHYRININGLTVWQKRDFARNLFKIDEVWELLSHLLSVTQ